MENESVICEALVREIGRATRWKAVEEAWQALLHVRRMAKAMGDERTYIATGVWRSDSADRTPPPGRKIG